jgi:rhamnulokinase
MQTSPTSPGRSLPSMVAIDLGAESCRVSLLEWADQTPHVSLVHRFDNAPVTAEGSIFWDLERILSGLEQGLLRCAERAKTPVASLGVDGWAVDYVRQGPTAGPLRPYCYRDARTEPIIEQMRARSSDEELYALTGAQPLRINTLYQLMADRQAGIPEAAQWTNLPEYVLTTLGGRRVAEFTNATHTGLVDIARREWSDAVFQKSGLDKTAAPPLVQTGTDLGELRRLPGAPEVFAKTRLIATACHDTASAVAAIPLQGDDWAYVSSGTWSLVGTLLDRPITSAASCAAGFTNQGAAGECVCFHKNVNGMWLLKQTMQQLCGHTDSWPMAELVAAAEALPGPGALLQVDETPLLLPGEMASRINAQRAEKGLSPIEETAEAMPRFASLIFHSLAARYAEILRDAERLTGKQFRRLAVVGGGSLNRFLNRLTQEVTGLEVHCGVAESSTIGNFAIQLATWEGEQNSRTRISHWVRLITGLHAG